MLNDTIETLHEYPIGGQFEPCHGFSARVPGSPVCTGCGWLADEHAAHAVVRRLPRRVAPQVRSRRLAS